MSEAASQDSTTRRTVLKGTAAAAVATASGLAPTRAGATPGPTSPSTTSPAPSTSPTPFGTPSKRVPDPGTRITAVGGDRLSGWSAQTRSEVLARNGVVATSQPLAAQAGLQILRDGGNSADAAIATAAMLGVVEPYSAGIGGDTFVIHYSAADRRLYGLNASGWAPSAWSPEYFAERGHDAETGMPLHGPDSITVPGAVDGWSQLLDRFGSTDFATVLQPAVTCAEEGFAVTERIRYDWDLWGGILRKDPDSRRTYLVNGAAPSLYSIFRNPLLARAYRQLQTTGRDAFYRGAITEATIAKITDRGGSMTAEDLAEFRSEWVEPIHSDYFGYRVHQLPPNVQGFATLVMLNILEQVEAVHRVKLSDLGSRSPLFWHLLVEAKKLAYDDLHRYNGDPRFTDVPLDRLLSKTYAKKLCRRIDLDRATPPKAREAAKGGTVYLTTADRWGNITSFIYSIYWEFGSGITVPGYGFPLHNRGNLFSLETDSPNIVAGRKRPFHTIIPAFVTRDGRPVLSFGNMGGAAQPQSQATEIVNMVNLGMNIQAAVDAARFYHDQTDDTLQLEPALRSLVGRELADKGHRLREADIATMGGYQAIHFTPEEPGAWPRSVGANGPVNGVYRAGSDHRKDGSAVGW